MNQQARGLGRGLSALLGDVSAAVPAGSAEGVRELDVSAIARESGGGGHRQAAGFSSDASIEVITDFLRREFLAASAPPR